MSRPEDRNITLLYIHDTEDRPYDRVQYREAHEGAFQTLTREDGESLPELKKRACDVRGLLGKRIRYVLFVGSDKTRRPAVYRRRI